MRTWGDGPGASRDESRRDLERRASTRGGGPLERLQVQVHELPGATFRPTIGPRLEEALEKRRKHHLELAGRDVGVLLQVPDDLTHKEWLQILRFVEARAIAAETSELDVDRRGPR